MAQAGERPLAVVTGAGSGIGRAVATTLLDCYETILCDLDDAKLAPFAGQAETCPGDLSAPATVERLVTAIGPRRAKTFVHAAGISPTMASSAEIVRINLVASLALCDAIGPLMAQGGAAVLLASIAAHTINDPSLLPLIEAVVAAPPEQRLATSLILADATPESGIGYGASKRGVVMLARARAVAWGRRGVRIVSVSPGIIETPMGRQELEAVPVMHHLIANSAAGRMGKPEEIAALISFLCSDAAAFITGTDFVADGGTLASWLG